MTKSMLCIAHRGGPLIANSPLPENSLAAIARALDFGVDAIEIDIYPIGKEFIVTHDRRLGRLTGGDGLISEKTFDELRSFRLTNGEPMPTLTEVLCLVRDRALLNIEIKGANSVSLLKQQLTSFVKDHQQSFEQYFISSFDHQQLHQCLHELPQVKRGVLIEGIPLDYAACCDALQAYSFNTHLSFLSPQLLDDARKRGVKNWVYTVNHVDDWQRMINWGVDAVFTDKPDALLDYLKNSSPRH
jgi:glycerophosphoryl diester phosphodiesterase